MKKARQNKKLKKWPGLLPAIFICDDLSYRRGGAVPGGGGGSERLSAVEQRRDVADGDAPVDRARPVDLLLQVLLAIALRGQVFRRHVELLRQQGRRRFGAAVRQRQIVDVVADRVGVALDQEHRARIFLDRPVEAVGDRLQLRRLIGRDFHDPSSKLMVLTSMLGMRWRTVGL